MKALLLFYFLTFICFNLSSIPDIANYVILDGLAKKHGTDKGSSWHNYTKYYAKYFSPLKDKPIKLLEIGLERGASARMWEEYFPLANLHFIDIVADSISNFMKNASPRSHCHLANQSDKASLSHFLTQAGSNFDIIIDDGGHSVQEQITSFEVLFPHVKSGGIYVIEDLFTSYLKNYYGREIGGYGTEESPCTGHNTTIEFLQKLSSEINSFTANHHCGDVHKNVKNVARSYYQQHIESIHFYNAICFILKR